MQIEGTKLIFVTKFSVLDFFRFASRMRQIAQIKLVSTFNIFQMGGRDCPPPPPPPPPLEILLLFSLAIPGSDNVDRDDLKFTCSDSFLHVSSHEQYKC